MNKKILICDDEEGIRESLKIILVDFYDLILVENAELCINTLKTNPDINLILLDIKMPKTNGLELLEQIKKKFPKKRCIVITGYKSVETASEATKRGANGYIVKPFKSDEILKKVRENI